MRPSKATGTVALAPARLAFALGLLIAAVANAAVTPSPTTPDEAASLPAGTVLGRDNWEAAKDLLPPEILRHYRDGEYANRIFDWPTGIYQWDPEFREATSNNRGRYTLSPEGTVLDASSGRQPPYVYGLPFPDIDPNDPQAAAKILWNFQYAYWNEGSSHNEAMLHWVSSDHVSREAVQTVHFLYYDGQNERYRPANSNNFSTQFIAVTLSPADINGTASLTWRYRDTRKRDSNWVYVPALRRIRAVSPANRSDGFLGSDMSQDDGPFFDGKPEDFTWRLVGKRDMLRLVDEGSFRDASKQSWMPGGGWRTKWDDVPVAGFQQPNWTGAAWAPVQASLARRSCWVIEGTPKDRYYLFGKIQLYIDEETFQGAWNRKFSWTGELLNTLQVPAYQIQPLRRPDGITEWQWASHFGYQCAENLKQNRATMAGLVPRGTDVPNDRRVGYSPSFFDAATLQRFGK